MSVLIAPGHAENVQAEKAEEKQPKKAAAKKEPRDSKESK